MRDEGYRIYIYGLTKYQSHGLHVQWVMVVRIILFFCLFFFIDSFSYTIFLTLFFPPPPLFLDPHHLTTSLSIQHVPSILGEKRSVFDKCVWLFEWFCLFSVFLSPFFYPLLQRDSLIPKIHSNCEITFISSPPV